ncbi:MAG: hypothetical protein KC457_30190, partial [Myxococcales bacterium]|nr:hypothetical protein [Myxococcales bacterium]
MPATYGEKEHLVSKSEAFEHATISVLQTARSELPGIQPWTRGAIAKAPTVIHDINGTPLFYDYEVKEGRATLGTIRTAASKILGDPDVAYELGARSWNFKAIAEKLLPKVQRANRGATVGKPLLVCYGYPKLGVMFPITGPRGKSRVIFDFSGVQVPEGDPAKGIEGAFAWSFYDSLKTNTRKAGLARYETIDTFRASLSPAVRQQITTVKAVSMLERRIAPWQLTKNVTRELAFCTHYLATHARGHHCFALHGQQQWDYCAVATAQMILDYYRYHYTQATIAPALGYAPGGCPSDQSPGYESLSHGHLEATFDGSPTWAKAKARIDAGEPFKTGIPGHARACAGYSYTQSILVPIGGSGVTNRRLMIYDPSPWNADDTVGGSVSWESWD